MKKRFSILIPLALTGVVALANATAAFQTAVPVWPDTGGDDLNRRVGFRVVIESPPADAVLRVATSGLYRATVDGEFLGHGPARGGHGHFRIDEWPLKRLQKDGPSVIGIEVSSSEARSYYMVKQAPFLQAEIVAGGRVLASTTDFAAVDLHPGVVRRVPRYSYQRTFSEVFRATPGWQAWRTEAEWSGVRMPLATKPIVRLEDRGAPYPEFAIVEAKGIARGTFKVLDPVPQRRYYGFQPEDYGDFPHAELEARPDRLMTSLKTTTLRGEATEKPIEPGSFQLFDLGVNLSGFVGIRVRVDQPMRLLATFDELRSGPHGSVDPHRLQCVNAVQIDLQKGAYEIETFEPYTLRYLQLHALDGAATIERVYLRELAHPHSSRASFASSDPRLDAIFEAARQTFRQNATDIFMDCPSRERAGWLCDSFFIGRVEADLTGKVEVERNFLENFAQPAVFPGLVAGMLPMCYPSDPYLGDHIPNWAMWFVLELEEYLARSGDRALVNRLRPRVEALMEYFARYENSDGLLEKLDGWVFVEWSEANKLVQDVNYPTNMLYAAALEAGGRLYGNPSWTLKAASMRQTINRQSFDGTFYRDHAKRLPNGTLEVRPERTEVCQYYAFFFNTTTPGQRPQLWRTLVEEFGPARRETKAHPEIFPCNQLPGNMLRIEILSRHGESERIHQEALGYWQEMAETTGTLWEHNKPQASCNHGFASHAAVVLRRDILGLREINHQERTVTFALPDNPLGHCRGSFPTAEGEIVVEWKRGGNPQLILPPGWRSMPSDSANRKSPGERHTGGKSNSTSVSSIGY